VRQARSLGSAGNAGSPINGELFHAQVLMSAHGFSPGVIDGKEGESFKLALSSFQEARGLNRSGKLDGPDPSRFAAGQSAVDGDGALAPDDVRSQYVYPFPTNPRAGRAEVPRLSQHAREARRALSHDADTIVALERAGQADRRGPGASAAQRRSDLARLCRGAGQWRQRDGALNVDGSQPQGDYVVVDKSEGVLKVYRGTAPGGAARERPRAERRAPGTQYRRQHSSSRPSR
jgi:peptidoglycan hydrolase-like protein with peptidoglycan-binding domain